MHETSPTYLSSLLQAYAPTRPLRSTYEVPPTLLLNLVSELHLLNLDHSAEWDQIWPFRFTNSKLTSVSLYFNWLITGHWVRTLCASVQHYTWVFVRVTNEYQHSYISWEESVHYLGIYLVNTRCKLSFSFIQCKRNFYAPFNSIRSHAR